MVSVPTRGVERWLTQRLSGRLGTSPGRADGVCANVDFPFPGRLVGGAVAAASGVDRDTDPWLPERAVWPLLDVVDAGMDEPWLATVAGHLAGSTRRPAPVQHRSPPRRPLRPLRRAPAGHGAGLGGRRRRRRRRRRAARRRPLAGRAVAPAPRHGSATPSPAERLDRRLRPARAGPRAGRPARPRLAVRPHPPAGQLPRRAPGPGRPPRRPPLPAPPLPRPVGPAWPAPASRAGAAPTTTPPTSPATRCWRRGAATPARCSWCSAGRPVDRPPPAPWPPATRTRSSGASRTTCATTEPPPGEPLPGQPDRRPRSTPTTAASRSTPATAGPARSRWCATPSSTCSPTTPPSKPATSSSCAPTSRPSPRSSTPPSAPAPIRRRRRRARVDLRVRLADRSLRQTNPVLGAVCELLALADARVTASQVLDFAGREPVRRRFRLDDDDLARISEWVAATGIRWGLDAAHRAPFELDGLGPEHLARRPRPAPPRRGHGRRGPAPGRRRRSPSTTSTAATSTSPAASPSSSTGSTAAVDSLAGRHDATGVGAGHRRRRRRPDRHPARRRLAARPARSASSTTSLAEVAADSAGPPLRAGRGPRRCSPTACGASRPGPTSAPATSPCARSCPCGRCPTGWCACSASTTAPSPAGPSADGDDLVLHRPPRRRPRPPQRGPPAAARRPAGRHRAPGRHLRRPRRAHQRRAAAGRARRRAARRRRPHGPGRRAARRPATPGRRPPPAAALRRPQLHAGAPGPGPARGASTRSPSTAPGPSPASARRRRRSSPAPCPPRRSEVVELDDLVRFVEHPVRAFLRQRLGISARRLDRRPGRRHARRARRARALERRRPHPRARLAGADIDACVAAERGPRPPAAGRPVGAGAGQDAPDDRPAPRGHAGRRGPTASRSTSASPTAACWSAPCPAWSAPWCAPSPTAGSGPSTAWRRGSATSLLDARLRRGEHRPPAGRRCPAAPRSPSPDWPPAHSTRRRRAVTSTTSSPSATRACASRCRSTAPRRPPTPSAGRARRALTAGPQGVGRAPGTRARTPTPSTSSCSGGVPPVRRRSLETTRGSTDYARRLWDRPPGRRDTEAGRQVTVAPPSTPAARCPPASPCSRPAPAPARRSPSPPWPPATWPTASRSSTCSSSPSPAWPPASCATGCGSGWCRPSRA